MKTTNKIYKFTIALLAVIAIVACGMFFVNKTPKKASAATYQQQVQEYRAVWVSNFVGNMPRYTTEEQYKADFNAILDNMESWNMNAIVFHIRTHNNALYKSSLNPLATWWANVDFNSFDPLAWSIEACHARGIEFHAWMNPYRIRVGSTTYYTGSLPSANPANNSANLLTGKYSSGSTTQDSVILDPGIPGNRQFIVDTCMEVIENYDVDAIHFDDYFYVQDCDDTATRNTYNTQGLSVGDFRRQQVNLFIEKLHNEVTAYNRANNKAIEIGIAPSSVYKNGSYAEGATPQYDANGSLVSPGASATSGFAHYDDYLYSDTKYWIDQEWIDYITPQSYHGVSNKYSPFGKITEWWNWVVEYKKVNLSMGIGLYMASDNLGSWTTADELQNQMLVANGRKNISGLCFYHYGSLLDSNANIQSHVATLKNNWSKKIPSTVKPQYTHLPEPTVTGIELNGNTLSWNKLDGVRGYMVWRVNVGGTVDTSNINHLYKYVQGNQITVESGYEYYVSSVNLANEISTPMSTNPLLAEMVADANTFKSTLKTDAMKNYQLPTSYKDYTVTWAYAKASDSALYNLTNGDVLVEYLATTPIELKGTLTKDGLTYTFSYSLNIGYTKTNETGLFYRNNPNAMNQAEGSGASFIGWSGKVMKFTLSGVNYVFFVADGNDFELTDGTIPEKHWGSCGALYHNATGASISGTGAQFGVSVTANYGYFIIGSNGLVTKCVADGSATETIILNAGEYIFCPQYLDSQITGSVMKPAINLAVGTKIEVLTAVWSDGDDSGDAGGNTGGDTGAGGETGGNTGGDTGTGEDTALVTVKETAISTLDNYVADMNAYSTSNQAKIQTYINNGKNAIQNATTVGVVNDLLATYKSYIDEVKTILQERKDQALSEGKNYAFNVGVTNSLSYIDLLNDFRQDLNDATTTTAVDQALFDFKTACDGLVKTGGENGGDAGDGGAGDNNGSAEGSGVSCGSSLNYGEGYLGFAVFIVALTALAIFVAVKRRG